MFLQKCPKILTDTNPKSPWIVCVLTRIYKCTILHHTVELYKYLLCKGSISYDRDDDVSFYEPTVH